jgi:hypothetical protein
MKENVITHLSHKMERLQIRGVPRVKKYLISQQTRNMLKSQDKSYVALIPFRAVNLPVYNKSKELFLHQTEILTKNDKMLVIPSSVKGKDELKKIQKYLETHIKIKVPTSKISKILDVETSKIKIYVVNLTDFQISKNKKDTEITEEDKMLVKIKKLSLNAKLDLEYLYSKKLKFQKILNFYNQIEVRSSIQEMYQNIGRLAQNRATLAKFITLELEGKEPSLVKYQLNLKYHFLYQMLAII